jgi:DNA invertase Pin-like site-specific DNA recombinase
MNQEPMHYGYARVSTPDQNLVLQIDALEKAGCKYIYKEKVSGATKERPELQKMLAKLEKSDTLTVWKLDRLGRSIRDLVNIINDLNKKGVQFISVMDGINTATATGRFTFHLFASLAEFEREIVSERTMAGLEAARARGRKGGRPQGLSEGALVNARIAKQLYDKKDIPVTDICKQLRISRTTFYNYLKLVEVEEKEKTNK